MSYNQNAGLKIQYINYSGKFTTTNFTVNKLSSLESFDDYDISIVDLSDSDIWRNNGSSEGSINCINDIYTLGHQVNSTKNKVIIILPQNITYRYYLTNGKYRYSYRLKDDNHIISFILETILYRGCPYSVIYNKTRSNIQGKLISCDFTFNTIGIGKEQIIVSAIAGTAITLIRHANSYLTTLHIVTEEDVLNLISEIGLNKQVEEEIPEWFDFIEFFNDKELNNALQEKNEKIDSLQKEKEEIEKEIDENNFYKGILYKNGQGLVDIVNQMLKDIFGYDYENFVDRKEEDFRFEYNGIHYIGEIKGISSNVKRTNISQTANHRDYFMEIDGNEKLKTNAIAIINRQRQMTPSDREKVSNDIEEYARKNDVLLILAEDFLRLYEQFKKDEITTEGIVDMFNTKGLLKF